MIYRVLKKRGKLEKLDKSLTDFLKVVTFYPLKDKGNRKSWQILGEGKAMIIFDCYVLAKSMREENGLFESVNVIKRI